MEVVNRTREKEKKKKRNKGEINAIMITNYNVTAKASRNEWGDDSENNRGKQRAKEKKRQVRFSVKYFIGQTLNGLGGGKANKCPLAARLSIDLNLREVCVTHRFPLGTSL